MLCTCRGLNKHNIIELFLFSTSFICLEKLTRSGVLFYRNVNLLEEEDVSRKNVDFIFATTIGWEGGAGAVQKFSASHYFNGRIFFFHKICKSFFLTLSLIACYILQITMDFNHKYDNDYNILPVKTNRMSTFKSK